MRAHSAAIEKPHESSASRMFRFRTAASTAARARAGAITRPLNRYRGFLRHRVLLNDASAAADRRNHVDARAGLERCLERAALAVDVDVDVRTQGPTRFAQTIA